MENTLPLRGDRTGPSLQLTSPALHIWSLYRPSTCQVSDPWVKGPQC